MIETGSAFRDAVGDFRSCWKQLALTDIAYKIVAFIVLTPLVGVAFRVLIASSGRSVLADQDILLFFLGPVGWVCFIAIGALWLGIIALEQSALMGIIAATQQQRHMSVMEALWFASANAWPVVSATLRLLALTLLMVAPFLVVAGLVYAKLLTDHDINYYLSERPPVFLAALGAGGVIAVALAAVLLRLFAGWFYVLPLVLFEDLGTASAFRVSRERSRGHRRNLVAWIVGWFLATSVFSTVATSVVIGVGRLTVPRVTGSLGLLALAVGVTLILWSAANLAVNLVSTTSFAAVLFNLYRHLGSQGEIDLSRLSVSAGDRAGFRITRIRLLGASVVGIALAVAVGTVVVRSVRLQDRAEITAHRGASAAAPENTMAAVKKAIEDRADWVEIDVQETADGKVVVVHDSDFMKVAKNPLKIWDATLADLQDIDIGSWFTPEFKDERVPKLGDVLDVCKGKIRVNIELKYYGHDERLEQRVAEIVKARGMQSNIVLMSLKLDAVEKMKSIEPDWKVGLLMSVSAGKLDTIDADFLAVNASFANRFFIRSAHQSGKEVHVWTVNDAPTMSTMIGRGVDSLITDEPALARSVLEQRAQMSAPERLLLELAGMLGVAPQIGEQ